MEEPLNLHVVCLEDSISVLIILDFNEMSGDERRVLTSEHYQTKVNIGGDNYRDIFQTNFPNSSLYSYNLLENPCSPRNFVTFNERRKLEGRVTSTNPLCNVLMSGIAGKVNNENICCATSLSSLPSPSPSSRSNIAQLRNSNFAGLFRGEREREKLKPIFQDPNLIFKTVLVTPRRFHG